MKMIEMTRFESSDDHSLLTVRYYLQILLQRVIEDKKAREEAKRIQDAQRGKCILSLDGGGVRGLFSIMVLEKVLEEVHHLEGGIGSPPKPCEVFDLIGGTSTGGLLAIMLGRLQMDIVSCKTAYRDMSKAIFQESWVFPGKKIITAIVGKSWLSGDALKAAICGVVSARISSKERTALKEAGRNPSEAPLLSPDESAPKCFVCATVDNTHDCVRLRSYRSNSEAGEPSSTEPS